MFRGLGFRAQGLRVALLQAPGQGIEGDKHDPGPVAASGLEDASIDLSLLGSL